MSKFQKVQIGDLLLKSGLITQADLERALKIQNEHPELRIGDILIKIGVITQEELISFLGKQLGVPYIDLSNFFPDAETLLSLPKNLVEEHRVVPLKKEGNKLVIAMVDPLDVIALDNISQVTGFELQPMIATESDINDFISRYYGEVEIPKEIKKEEKDIEIFWKEGEPITPDVPIVPLVDFLISRAYSLNASDFHLEPRENDVRVRYRIDGVTLDFIPLPKEIQNAVISRIKLLANLDITETKLPQEGRFNTRVKDREVDVRVSIIPTIYGEKVAVKIFRRENSLLKIEELGMSKEDLKSFQEMIQIPYGLVIIAGPTGSGKSTTFYAILEKLNTPFRSIITLEEPVEYPLKNINQVSINPKVGLTYASALQFIFRQIPDIVMIGEIKDKETAEIAIDTALAGTFIVTTINAYDAISALVRLINIGIEPYLLCTTLIGVIAQRLVRILCPFCKTPYFPSEEQIKKLGIKSKEKIELFKPKGCKFCNNTGYKGRTGIFEILRINPEIQNLIMEKSFKSQILEVAKETGFIPLKEKAIQKVIDGITSEEELYRIL